MLTLKGVSYDLASVIGLYVAVWLYRVFSEVSTTRTSGRGALGGSFVHIFESPAFWIVAVLLFCVSLYRLRARA